MRRNVSLMGLIVVVLAIGLALAALRAGSFAWLRAMYTATAFAFLLSVLAAKYHRDTFWFGFAVFGWAYFLLGIGPVTNWLPVSDVVQGPILQPHINPVLPNNDLLERLAIAQARHLSPPPLPDD